MYVTKQIVTTVTKKELIIVYSIFKKIFYKFDNTFIQYKSVSQSLSQCNIEVIFQFKIRLSNLFKFKAPFPYVFARTLFTNFSGVIAMLLIIAKTERHPKVRAGKIKYIHINR